MIRGKLKRMEMMNAPTRESDTGIRTILEGPQGRAEMEVYHETDTHEQRIMLSDDVNNVDMSWQNFMLLMHHLAFRHAYTRPCEHKGLSLSRLTKSYETSAVNDDGSAFAWNLTDEAEQVDMVTAFYCPDCKRWYEAIQRPDGTYGRGEETTLWNLNVRFMLESMKHVEDGWPDLDDEIDYNLGISFKDLIGHLSRMRETPSDE